LDIEDLNDMLLLEGQSFESFVNDTLSGLLEKEDNMPLPFMIVFDKDLNAYHNVHNYSEHADNFSSCS